MKLTFNSLISEVLLMIYCGSGHWEVKWPVVTVKFRLSLQHYWFEQIQGSKLECCKACKNDKIIKITIIIIVAFICT